jgi:hypothetical protein
MARFQLVDHPLVGFVGEFAGFQRGAGQCRGKQGDGGRAADAVFTMHHQRNLEGRGVQFADEGADPGRHVVVEQTRAGWHEFVGRHRIVEGKAQHVAEQRVEFGFRRGRVGNRNDRHVGRAAQLLGQATFVAGTAS